MKSCGRISEKNKGALSQSVNLYIFIGEYTVADTYLPVQANICRNPLLELGWGGAKVFQGPNRPPRFGQASLEVPQLTARAYITCTGRRGSTCTICMQFVCKLLRLYVLPLNSRDSKAAIIIIIVVRRLPSSVAFLFCRSCCWRRKKKHHHKNGNGNHHHHHHFYFFEHQKQQSRHSTILQQPPTKKQQTKINKWMPRQEGLTDDFQSIDHHSFLTLTLDHDSGSLESLFSDELE